MIHDIIVEQLPYINELIQRHSKEIIEAHYTMSRTQYCNLNGDVSILDDCIATVSKNVGDIHQVLRKGGSAGIKTNGIEHYSPYMARIAKYILDLVECDDTSHITLHVFESKDTTQSFPMHTDPADVVLCMLAGSKTLNLDTDTGVLAHKVSPDTPLYIPMNVPHEAINHEDNIMLSIGIERYTIEHIEREG